MRVIDRPILARYVAAFRKRGLTAIAAHHRGKEAFQLVQTACTAMEAGRQSSKAKLWQRQVAEVHRRAISRIGELRRRAKK
jgi:hypothetical protein